MGRHGFKGFLGLLTVLLSLTVWIVGFLNYQPPPRALFRSSTTIPNEIPMTPKERICAAAMKHAQSTRELLGDDDESRKFGVSFLYLNHGVLFGLPDVNVVDCRSNSSQNRRLIQIPMYSCGETCTGDCSVSFHAQLVGAQIIQAVDIVAHEQSGDYALEFLCPPPVVHDEPQLYALSAEVKWWRGMLDPSPDNSTEYPIFLGPSGRLNFHPNEAFRRRQQAGHVSGSPLSLPVVHRDDVKPKANSSSASKHAPAEQQELLPTCQDLNQPAGFWKRTKPDSLGCANAATPPEHPGECFVLDKANPHWLWQGESCQYKFLTPHEVSQCLEDTTIYVFGDSLTAEFYTNLLQYLLNAAAADPRTALRIPQRVFWNEMEPFFGPLLNQSSQTTTSRTFVVADFNVAHLVREHSLEYIESVVVPKIQADWSHIVQTQKMNLPNSNNPVRMEGIFYTGYPAHFERERFISRPRMLRANAILAQATRALGFTVFDTTLPLMSRPDASWDGFHFSQRREGVGGVSKMLTMMLLQHICG